MKTGPLLVRVACHVKRDFGKEYTDAHAHSSGAPFMPNKTTGKVESRGGGVRETGERLGTKEGAREKN